MVINVDCNVIFIVYMYAHLHICVCLLLNCYTLIYYSLEVYTV